MMAEDLKEFTELLQNAARTSTRHKPLDEADVAAYFSGLRDWSLTRVRERLTYLQRKVKFFPSLASIRQDAGQRDDDESPGAYSSDWWKEVRSLEHRLDRAMGYRHTGRIVVTDAPQEVIDAELEVQRAARAVAVHAGTPAAEACEKRYERAAMIRHHARAIAEIAHIEALPPMDSENGNAARKEWVRRLKAIAASCLLAIATEAEPH